MKEEKLLNFFHEANIKLDTKQYKNIFKEKIINQLFHLRAFAKILVDSQVLANYIP